MRRQGMQICRKTVQPEAAEHQAVQKVRGVKAGMLVVSQSQGDQSRVKLRERLKPRTAEEVAVTDMLPLAHEETQAWNLHVAMRKSLEVS